MEKRMLVPPEILNEVINVGIKKAKLGIIQLIILGIMAGAFIAFGGFAASMASHSIDNPGIAKFLSGAVFPVGLMMVIICGAELFTGNCLMIVAMLEKRINLAQILKNWIIVYASNFIGAFVIAILITGSGLLSTNSGKLGGYAIKIASYKGGLTFLQGLSSGILCNILVCIAVWGAYAAKDIVSKIAIIWFPIMAFVLSGFEHSIANMYYFSIGIMAKLNPNMVDISHVGEKIANVSLGHMIRNLVPVTLGNIVGGVIFVGVAYWVSYRSSPVTDSAKGNEIKI